MALPKIEVKIGADASELDRTLRRSRAALAGLAKAAVAAGVAFSGALTAMTVAGLSAVDAQTKLARSLDGSASSLRAVQIAAGYAGVSVGEANTAMQQLNRELERAKEEGTPAQQALAKLGMSAVELQRLDVDQRMAAIADRVKELGLTSGQASDILRDLGVRSRNMALLLLQGGDAIRSAREEVTNFGLELSKTQTDSIEGANDAVARMALVFEALRNKLAIAVAPILQKVADQFNALAQSDAVQNAIERLAAAFGALAATILTENFMQAAISGLAGIAQIGATVAEGMVTVSQNVEAVTLAFSALAIAVAAAGGPLTVVAGLLAVALGGIAAWRAKSEEMATATDVATEAQNALNEALGTFVQTGAPSAGKSAIDLANDNYKLAESALAAAEAELAKREASRERGARPGGVRGPSRARLFEAEDEAQVELDAARARLEEAKRARERAARAVMGADYSGESGQNGNDALTQVQNIRDVLQGMLEDGTTLGNVLGQGGVVNADGEVQTLAESLLTKREQLENWYAEQKDILASASEDELAIIGGYNEAKLRLEAEYQRRLARLKSSGNKNMISETLSAGKTILQAVGQTNEKAFKIAQAFGAAEVLVNAFVGASQELKEKGVIGIATAASVIAAGVGFVTSLRSIRPSTSSGGVTGGFGGGFGGASAASATPTPAAAPEVSRNVAIKLEGGVFGRDQVISLINEINEAVEDGAVVRLA